MSASSRLAQTPEPPYYAVIFTSIRTEGDRGYAEMAERMEQLGSRYSGFLGMESVRQSDGFGITVSYWRDESAIRAWKTDAEHLAAQQAGKKTWYAQYHVRIAKVERAYGAEF